MLKKIIIFLIIVCACSTVYAPPSKRVTIRISSISNVAFIHQNKDIICHADEKESIDFKLVVVVGRDRKTDNPVSVSALPHGAICSNNTFHWVPNENQSGIYEITFSARLPRSKVDQKVIISISNNMLRMRVGETYREFLKAYDPDGDMIRIIFVGPPRGFFTCALMPEERSVSWTPSSDQIGVHEFTILAIDMPKDGGEFIHIIEKQDVRHMSITVDP